MALSVDKRIESFTELGNVLRWLVSGKESKTPSDLHLKWQSEFSKVLRKSTEANPWFTNIFIKHALESIVLSIHERKIRRWLSSYTNIPENGHGKRIGVIMAGNIPFVGFHDFISVLITGNYFIGKPSAREGKLMEMLAGILMDIEPEFKKHISFRPTKLTNIDAVIATGSNNTSRYFKHEYKNLPSLIRKNGNGVAILDGTESMAELEALTNDIFLYFGLGCRNVSKLYIPIDFDFYSLLKALNKHEYIDKHAGYMNNYHYQSAIYKTEKVRVLDTGFLILKEEFDISSPIGVLYYQYYNTREELVKILKSNTEQIQCKVGKNNSEYIPFGKTQYPELWDYSDNVDTINFLNSF